MRDKCVNVHFLPHSPRARCVSSLEPSVRSLCCRETRKIGRGQRDNRGYRSRNLRAPDSSSMESPALVSRGGCNLTHAICIIGPRRSDSIVTDKESVHLCVFRWWWKIVGYTSNIGRLSARFRRKYRRSKRSREREYYLTYEVCLFYFNGMPLDKLGHVIFFREMLGGINPCRRAFNIQYLGGCRVKIPRQDLESAQCLIGSLDQRLSCAI